MQRCWWHKMYWSKKLSLVFERTSILSYSHGFQSNARQDEGMIFLLTTEKFCFVLYSLSEKKKTGLAWTNVVLRRILTVFIKIIKLSTVFPNIPFVESVHYDFIFVFNIDWAKANYGRQLCSTLCILKNRKTFVARNLIAQ